MSGLILSECNISVVCSSCISQLWCNVEVAFVASFQGRKPSTILIQQESLDDSVLGRAQLAFLRTFSGVVGSAHRLNQFCVGTSFDEKTKNTVFLRNSRTSERGRLRDLRAGRKNSPFCNAEEVVTHSGWRLGS